VHVSGWWFIDTRQVNDIFLGGLSMNTCLYRATLGPGVVTVLVNEKCSMIIDNR
jgi:hypothetical protein